MENNDLTNEIYGAENAVKKMLMYYISALNASGVENSKEVVVHRISELIDLSYEQQQIIMMNLSNEGKIINSAKECIKLIDKMEDENEIDLDSIYIIKQFLELLLKDFKDFHYEKLD